MVEVARSYLDAPFSHHFSPHNLCQSGAITISSCMEQGLDAEGFDCSGLVIASVCEVVGIQTKDWNPNYRHLEQFKSLESRQPPELGDILLFYPDMASKTRVLPHVGIRTVGENVIHSSGKSGIVEEGQVEGRFEKIGAVPLLELVRAGTY